jgi:hypothetical protein
MTLSLVDIERWDPAAITTVFQAAIARAHGTRMASAAIGETMGFLDWNGDTGEAARAAAHRTVVDLDSHADACEAVGRAAQKAARDVAEVKLRLQKIRSTASDYHLSVNDETAAVGLPANLFSFSAADQREIEDAQFRVLLAIRQLLSDAESADADLAAAIRGADGDLSSEQVNAETGDDPPRMPALPPPQAIPDEVNKWWRSLTPSQQDRVKEWFGDSIRNLDGIPTDIRDELNMTALRREIARIQNGWLDRNGHVHIDPDKLADLTALRNTLRSHPDISLLRLDTTSNPRKVLAAIAKGDVDNAERVGVTVGGMRTSVRDGVDGMAQEAIAQYDTAATLRGYAGFPNPKAVASIAWLGYEAPGLDLSVTGDAMARAGAAPLNRFYHGLAATSNVADQQITAFGHSYGSLTTSLALQQGAPVDDVVLYGSPGAEIRDASQLGVGPGHAYFEIGASDAVPTVIAETHRFGAPLQEVPGFRQLSTYAGVDPYRSYHDWSYGHSEYARMGDVNKHTLTMGGYNLAAVLSGVPNATVAAPGPWPPGMILGPDGQPLPDSAYPP